MTAQRTRPDDLAGRWLTRFFTDHLVGERAASPRTIAAYRDAIKLLLTWFKTAERIGPEKRVSRTQKEESCRRPLTYAELCERWRLLALQRRPTGAGAKPPWCCVG